MPQYQTRAPRLRCQQPHTVWAEDRSTSLPWWLALAIPAIIVGGWVAWL